MRKTLANTFVFIIMGITGLGLLNGLMALFFTQLAANSFESAISKNLPSIIAAEELEIALLNQKGLVSAYILSEGDSSWLKLLEEAEAEFAPWLARAMATADSTEETNILDRLEKVYTDYDTKRVNAILQFKRGHRNEAISTLFHDVWPTYKIAYDLCEDFIEANQLQVGTTTMKAERDIAFATWGVLIGSLGTVSLAMVLLWLVIQGVLIPARRMVAEARGLMGTAPGVTAEILDDELRSVGVYFRALMEDMTAAHTTLAESRNRLLHAEKLASVGKLAASVAHEMRNPLSSMKMWLYSIRKTTNAEPALARKLGILSDEIDRLESIVHNFLEFSRPPVLKLQTHCILQLIEKTLELVQPWLETMNIRVIQHHSDSLPHVVADLDQLKQVFTNLLHNSAEAMPEGGEISISSVAEVDASGASSVVVRIQDTGQGLPENVRSRMFEPFFTTKDDGMGLGLCIAANIMAQHGGWIVLESSTSSGTTFAVRIPIATEKSNEQNSRC